jgi:phospholipase/carboxylesterase
MIYAIRRPEPPPASSEVAPRLGKAGKFDSEDEKPPVLIVLHGYGTDEYDLLPIAEQIGRQFLIISLQAPIERPNGGHAWYDLIQTENGIIPDDLSRHESEEMLVANLANIINQEGGDVNRVVLMGFSQGAAVIYSLLIVYDLKNYGITPIASINLSGYIPRDILEAISEKQFDGFPFFISHGEFDELIPMQALGEAEKLLTKQGADVTARMYSVGHGALPETVEDIISWMKLKIRIKN